MKKGKKAAIIIIAVIAAAAIVVGGLVLGGVIHVGNKRTASAQEIAVDDTAMTAYKTIPQVYKITLKSLYGMSADDVAKFYENNCLLQQAFVKDGSVTVEQYMNSAAKALGGSVKFVDAVRFEKGEGIEKKVDDFAAEVAAAAGLAK